MTETTRPDQRAISLYDRYTHGDMGRREFLERLTTHAGSAAAATVLLSTLSNDFARAAIVDPNDKRLAIETSRGWTVECRGTSSTSSNVKATPGLIRLM